MHQAGLRKARWEVSFTAGAIGNKRSNVGIHTPEAILEATIGATRGNQGLDHKEAFIYPLRKQ